MAEQRLPGHPAAPGVAEGVIFRTGATTAQRRATGDAAEEARALDAAVAVAAREVAALVAREADEAADILSFQVAMLEDPALVEAAHAAIAEGAPADAAWRAAMADEIATYEAGDDPYFAARAADLRDIQARVLAHLTGAATHAPPPPSAIIVADDLTPSAFLAADWSRGGGIALAAGSPASHVAMLARARGVPMLVGLGGGLLTVAAGTPALLEVEEGLLVVSPTAATRDAAAARAGSRARAAEQAQRFLRAPAITACGAPVRVMVNVGDPRELDDLDPAICDGVGLTRTEFQFPADGTLPDEATQADAYGRTVRWAAGRPVVLRALDAGGDKPIDGLTPRGEGNPFLGLRGIRLLLARPEVLRVQLRAMLRASALGPVRIMLPMVAVPGEVDAVRAMLAAEAAALALPMPPLGIMVEVPAAALCAEQFAADFYSIGSNDLTQYTLAAARDIAAVAALNDAGNPAVLALIARTVAAGSARGVEVSLCGDAAGEPRLVAPLLRAGLRTLSVAPRLVAATKQAIAAVRLS
jgi:phosphotransferase system enzyme I (PtsI)